MRRTTEDWLTHARAADDPAEVERCLVAAIAQDASFHGSLSLLRGAAEMPLVTPERLTDLADRTLALAVTWCEVWGFRSVAEIRAGRLGDDQGARAALEMGVTVLREPKDRTLWLAAPQFDSFAFARGYEWVLLGQGFVSTLGDAAGMRRCLEIGRDIARVHGTADDLCAIAVEWAKCVDQAASAAMVLEAEQTAGSDPFLPWKLAGAWSTLGDADAVHRVLDGALDAATSSEEALRVAWAWTSQRAPDESKRALARAGQLANTAQEWLEIAESTLDAGLGESAVRLALERAEALASDDDARARVSSAYKLWLHDESAAARLGPAGVRPEGLRRRVRSLEGWETSASRLFDWLRARVTPAELASIAGADHGWEEDKNLAALRDICETGLVPRAIGWGPLEVLRLRSWSSGESVDHVERALCCTLLCLATPDDELVAKGPVLAESCLALGPEARHLAELFFAWRSETEAYGDDLGTDGIGSEQPIALLLLLLLRTASTPGDPRLEALGRMLTEHPCHDLGAVATANTRSMRANTWTDLIEQILVPVRRTHPETARVLAGLRR